MKPIHSPFDPDRNLTDDELAVERTLRRTEPDSHDDLPHPDYRIHPADRLLVRGPWELAASILIAIGVFMMMQPFFLWAFTWSFLVTLAGTVMFIVVSHFPE